MKNILKYLSIVLLALSLGSCEQKFTAEVPEVLLFTYDPMPAVAGSATTFSIETNADLAVLWSGLENSKYDEHLLTPSVDNKGVSISLEYDRFDDVYKGSKFINFPTDSSYHVMLVLTNVGDLGEVIEQITEELTVVVEPAPPQ